jgi:hypothetical protein
MEQSPSQELNSHWASQEIPCLLWDPKVHYHVCMCLPLVLILSHMHPVHFSHAHYIPPISIIHYKCAKKTGVQFLSGTGIFLFTHPGIGVSYPMGTKGTFPICKVAGEWGWQLTSIQCWD